MKDAENLSLRLAVLHAVRDLGCCTISEVLAEVGRLIPAPHAVQRFQSRYRADAKRRNQKSAIGDMSPQYMAELGRKKVVTDTINKLWRTGHLERVAPGRYRVSRKGKKA
jgi:hypothetical protein